MPPTSAAAVLANAASLLPLIAAEADAIEEAAQLTPRAATAMRAAGVFEMGFPASRGGLEMTLAQQVEVVALVAAVDASAAWNVGVLNAGGVYAGRLGDAAYAELIPPATGRPVGRSTRVAGPSVSTAATWSRAAGTGGAAATSPSTSSAGAWCSTATSR